MNDLDDIEIGLPGGKILIIDMIDRMVIDRMVIDRMVIDRMVIDG